MCRPSSDGIELEVEPISIFDLFSSGKFSFVVAGNANIDITELNYDYETDVGPLNSKVKLDFQPKLEATYEFGSQMRFTGRLFGDWNAEIAIRVFGSESASLEREFPIEPLSFEVEYKGKVKKKKPFPFEIKLKTTVNGFASVKAEGSVEFSSIMQSWGLVEEIFNYEGSLNHISRTSTPIVKVTPSAKTIGNTSVLFSIRPDINFVSAQGIMNNTVKLIQDYVMDMGVMNIPKPEIVNSVYPGRIIHLSNFDIHSETKCTVETKMFGLIPINKADACKERFELFHLPMISLSERMKECSAHEINYKEWDGVNSVTDVLSISWFSKAGTNPVYLGPDSVLTWDHPTTELEATAVFSASTVPLGEASRRFWTTPIKTNYTYTYKVVNIFALEDDDPQYIGTGLTPEEACEAFALIHDPWDYGWTYRRTEGSSCVVAAGGYDEGEEFDHVYVPMHSERECR